MHEHRLLELAIQWNNLPMIAQVLAGKNKEKGAAAGEQDQLNDNSPPYAKWERPRYNMQAALQLALEQQKGEHIARARATEPSVHAIRRRR